MAWTRLELQALAVQSASGNTAPYDVPEQMGGEFFVNYTANTGSPTNITFFAQTSDDNGTTWYTQAMDLTWKSGAVAANQENIAVATATGKYWGRCNFLYGNLIRVAWTISGGSAPTFTFSIVFHGK